MWRRLLGELMFLIGISVLFFLWNLDTDGIGLWRYLIYFLIIGIAWTIFSFGFDLMLGARLQEIEKEIEEHGKPLF